MFKFSFGPQRPNFTSKPLNPKVYDFFQNALNNNQCVHCTSVQNLTLNSSINCGIFSKPVCKMLAIEFQNKNKSRFHKQHAVSISIISGV